MTRTNPDRSGFWGVNPGGIAPPDDVVAPTIQERAWSSPIWYTPSAEAGKAAKPGTTVDALKKQGAVPLTDVQLKGSSSRSRSGSRTR